MKLIELFDNEKPESEQTQKAGVIPFIIEDGEPIMNFFISSDADYGGPNPQIAKGGTKEGEDLEKAAIREGEEELGLKRSNIKNIFKVSNTKISGMTHSYNLIVYAVEVKSKQDFNKQGSEAKETVWLSLNDFRDKGRRSQFNIVKSAHDKIKKA